MVIHGCLNSYPYLDIFRCEINSDQIFFILVCYMLGVNIDVLGLFGYMYEFFL